MLTISANSRAKDPTDPILLSWFRASRFPNLGDELAPWINSVMSMRPVRYVPPFTPGTMLSVGSILSWSMHNSAMVWGTGFIRSEAPDRSLQDIRAVRGHGTLQKLRDFGFLGEVPVGDPALLVPLLLGSLGASNPIRHEIGIIPHYADFDNVRKRIAASTIRNNVRLIDIRTDNIEAFAHEVLGCRVLFSSSLHGLILSDVLGRPAQWVEFSDKVFGNGFKFEDYFSHPAVEARPAIDLTDMEVPLSVLMDLGQANSGPFFDWSKFDAPTFAASNPYAADRVLEKLERRWSALVRV